MTVLPRQIGVYEIRREVGRGGMGVVYLARDTSLDRDVAIKVLPEEVSGDPDRLTRFEREARLLASLNHANVAGIYGIEEAEGARYLILEYVDGDDLSARLRGGPLPIDEALHIGKQIARAVEAAHGKGVIHRDLKPANVKVTVDGDVKVLDFGLAKAFEDDVALSGPNSPTVVPADSPSVPGVVLGTAGYMSPEQARGKPIDKRSDIWSFGCILYEMLTGQCPFPGESVTESLGATIHKEPDWKHLPEAIPPNVQLLLHRCLQKDRSRRLQDIGDARVELDDTLSGSTQIWTSGVTIPEPGAAKRRRVAPWVAATFLVPVAAVALTLVGTRLTRPDPPVMRVSVSPPPETNFIPVGDLAGPVVVSPDGRMLAFTALTSGGQREIWVRSLDVLEARVLQGTEDGVFPFWSADSRSLGFFADGWLKRVEISGGTPIRICEATNGRGGSWKSDDVILFAPNFQTPIHRVSANGGTPEPITTIDPERHTSHRWPFVLPDGEHFLYSGIHHEESRGEENAVFFASLDGSVNREVIRSSINAEYADGRLIFLRDGTLMAADFDAAGGRLTGDPQALATTVAHSVATWRGSFSSSPSRVIAYHEGGAVHGEGTRIRWFDRAGTELEEVVQTTSSSSLSLSPAGERLAFVTQGSASNDVWVYELDRGLPMRLTFMNGFEAGPVWSPDGTQIAFGFIFRTGGDDAIGVYRISGSGGPPELLAEAVDTQLWPSDWSPDGRHLLYHRGIFLSSERTDLLVLPVDPPGEPFEFLATPHTEWSGVFSPDGKWIAYASDESGTQEIYVAPFIPTSGTDATRSRSKWQISSGGGAQPRWSHDGSELYYISQDQMLTAVSVSMSGGHFQPGSVQELFEISLGPGNAWDVTTDGRFVATSPHAESGEPIELILNWTSELDR